MRLTLVTGAAVGIGRGIAASLANLGDRVILLDTDKAALDAAAAELSESRVPVSTLHTDLLADDLESIVRRSINATGVDSLGLVNCASLRPKSDLWSESRESWLNQVLVGAWAPFALSRLFVDLALKLEISCRIVNISSVLSQLVGDQSPGYHSAKAALEQLTRYVAVHGPRTGARVGVNALQLGLIVQERHAERFLNQANHTWRHLCQKFIPRGSVGKQTDVADAVVWLLSPKAEFLNGAILVLDGGGSIQEQLFVAK